MSCCLLAAGGQNTWVTQQDGDRCEEHIRAQMRAGFVCPGVIQHLEQQHKPMQQDIASPLYNYISSAMFKRFYWMRSLLISSLPAEALDTFPAHWIINLWPLCLHPILDNPLCIVNRSERGGEGKHILLLPLSSVLLCPVDICTQMDTYALERITTIRGVSQHRAHITQTPTSWPSNSIKTSHFCQAAFSPV